MVHELATMHDLTCGTVHSIPTEDIRRPGQDFPAESPKVVHGQDRGVSRSQ
jgi:hypothetical protein